MFLQLSKLGCEEICFIGGNPFLELEKMQKIVMIANLHGIHKYGVYSHQYNISDQALEFMKKYCFTFYVTILSFDKTTYKKVSGFELEEEEIFNSLHKLMQNNILCIANIIVGKFNESEYEEIVQTLIKHNILYKLNYIYNLPENVFYSEKILDAIYDKTPDFPLVTKESISFLEEYNSCFWGQVAINIAGDILPCPMMNGYVLGNIRNVEGIGSVLRRKQYQELVELNRSKIKSCCQCEYRLNCLDCRAIEFAATEDILGQEYCQYSKGKG